MCDAEIVAFYVIEQCEVESAAVRTQDSYYDLSDMLILHPHMVSSIEVLDRNAYDLATFVGTRGPTSVVST